MTKFIFHGGDTSSPSNSNQTFFKELVKDIPEDGTLLLVYFASRSDDYTDRIENDTQKCKEASEGKMIHIEVATKENFLKQVGEANAVYLRGGSTQKLLEALKVYPDIGKHFEGKTVAGSSAGAYALSTLYSSHYEDFAASGLGIVPVRVVTHFQSEKMPPKAGAIEALKNTAKNLQLLILKEGEWDIITV